MLRTVSGVTVACLLVFTVVLSGCGRTACKRLCECTPAMVEETCIDECESRYDDYDSDCRSAFRDYARCLDDNDCSMTSCEAEGADWEDAC